MRAALYQAAHGALILDATRRLAACTTSTSLRGFADAQVSIAESSLDEQLRIAARSNLPVLTVGGGEGAAYEGRLEDVPIGGQTLQLRAFGAARAMDDVPYTALWSETRVDGYDKVTADVIAARVPEKFTMDNNNRLFIGMLKGTAYANGERAAWRYIIPSRSTRNVVGIQFSYTALSAVNVNGRYVSVEEDYATGASTIFMIGTGVAQTGALHVVLGTARPVIFFELTNETGGVVNYALENGVHFLKVTNVRLVTSAANRVNTTLTVARPGGSPVACTVGSTTRMYVGQQLVIGSGTANSEMTTVLAVTSSTTFNCNLLNAPGGPGYPIGTTVQGFVIYPDEIVKDCVTTVAALNTTQLAAATNRVQAGDIDCLTEVWEDASMSDVLTKMASYGDTAKNPWGWWVDREKVLVFERRGLNSYTFYVDVSEDQIQIERSVDDLVNSAYATYQEAAGRTLRTSTTTDAPSVARYGATRRTAVPVQTTSSTQAGLIRDTSLQDAKTPQPKIRVMVDRLFDAGGNRVPIWAPNAGRGDTIVIRNLSPVLPGDADQLRRWRLGRATVDWLAGTVTLESETPPASLETMLAQQEART